MGYLSNEERGCGSVGGRGGGVASLAVHTWGMSSDHINFAEPLFGAFALKLILNAISTGANILKGKVYHNTMINLTMANDKVLK